MSELESLMELIARQQSDLLQHIQVLVRRDVERYEHDVLAAGVAQPVPDWARSVYVDNTQSAAAVTLTFDVGLRFLVPAGAGVVLPCAKFRSVVASQQVQVLWASARAPLAQVGGPGSAAVPADVQVVGTAAVQLTGSSAIYGPLAVVFPDTVISVPSGAVYINQIIQAADGLVFKRMLLFLKNNTGVSSNVFIYPGNRLDAGVQNGIFIGNPSSVSVTIGSGYGYYPIENVWAAPNSRQNSLSVPAFLVQFMFASSLTSASSVEIEVLGLPG